MRHDRTLQYKKPNEYYNLFFTNFLLKCFIEKQACYTKLHLYIYQKNA